jgi:hypothetical protein
MPPEYNPIHHGQFLQLMGELGLGPDDVAAILQVDASIIKRAYKGTKVIRPDQLNTLWNLYINWLFWCDKTCTDINSKLPDNIGYVVYSNQTDYLAAPHDGLVWPTYKVHLNLMARAASLLDNQVYLIPYQSNIYIDWLGDKTDSYGMRQLWANTIAHQTRS